MGKTLKYGGHSFPSECGFTGSAGKVCVKGYTRGGPVRAPKAVAASPVAISGKGALKDPLITKPSQAKAMVLASAKLSKPDFQARARRPGGFAAGGRVCGAKKGVPAFGGKPRIGS